MKKVLIVLLFCSLGINAQTTRRFEFVKVDSTFSIPSDVTLSLPSDVKFGGISGIEYFNNAMYLVSDRAFNNKIDQNSYVFRMDTVGKISAAFKFFGVDNAESIRFDNLTQKMYYTFERDDSTGVGFINENNLQNNLAAFSMTNDSMTADNRGIESLCFDQNRNLWFAFESSSKKTLPFFSYPYNAATKGYDSNQKKRFEYPFDTHSCLNANQALNGSIGNGVTEILPLENNKLLVMERCFNGFFINMKLFEVEIPEYGNVLKKEQVFEFSINNDFLEENKALRPDNMEGMTWGKDENGQRILYVISDDNFNPKRQKTLLLKLKEVK